MEESLPNFDEIVVCLIDGEYHLGLAGLANSLTKSGFEGLIHVAFRGSLPPWVKQLKPINDSSFYLTREIIIHFEEVHTDMHLAYYKPYFIKEAFNKYHNANKVFYFDVDIVVNASWNFFSNWLADDICFCIDSNFGFVHYNHPWRKEWRKLNGNDPECFNGTNYYVNSGFIGISRKNILLINKWIELTELYRQTGDDLKQILQDGHRSYKGDQDLLNAAITVTPEIVLSIIGKEGMGFGHPAYLMTHATGENKPWKKNFLKHLLVKGRKPSFSEKNFFKFCRYPINLYSPVEHFFIKVNLYVTSVLGRFIGY
jgi:hypothetical protein